MFSALLCQKQLSKRDLARELDQCSFDKTDKTMYKHKRYEACAMNLLV